MKSFLLSDNLTLTVQNSTALTVQVYLITNALGGRGL
jgi:hypothetical protein